MAVVLDNSKSGSERIALYVNGVRETLQLSNGTPDDLKEINLTSDFYIGQSDGKRRLNGAISYARIWTKALSDQQISEQSGKLLSEDKDGMVANWLFNNGMVIPRHLCPWQERASKQRRQILFQVGKQIRYWKQVLLQNNCKKIG